MQYLEASERSLSISVEKMSAAEKLRLILLARRNSERREEMTQMLFLTYFIEAKPEEENLLLLKPSEIYPEAEKYQYREKIEASSVTWEMKM